MEYSVDTVIARLELHVGYYYSVVALILHFAAVVAVETVIAAVAAATFAVEPVDVVVAFAVGMVVVVAFEVGMAGPETAVVVRLRRNFASHYFVHSAAAAGGMGYIQRIVAKLWGWHQQRQS